MVVTSLGFFSFIFKLRSSVGRDIVRFYQPTGVGGVALVWLCVVTIRIRKTNCATRVLNIINKH